MGRTLTRPRSLLLVLLPLLLALVAAGGMHARLGTVAAGVALPPDLSLALDAKTLDAPRTAALERQWIAAAFPAAAETYLLSPALRFPCPQDVKNAPRALRDDVATELAAARGGDAAALQRLAALHWANSNSWLPGLTLGVLFVQEERLGEARTVLEEVRERMTRALDEARAAARDDAPRRGPDDETVRAIVHLLHAYGYVLIEIGEGGRTLWQALRYAIACTDLLALRGATDRIAGLPTWDRHRIAAPGCAVSTDALTSFDLYNNLIVGYLLRPDFTDTAGRRAVEFKRTYEETPAVNPLLAVLKGAVLAKDATTAAELREHWLWAVSNAERLLKERRHSGLGPLENPRLAANLAQLMGNALARVGGPNSPAVRTALLAAARPLADTAHQGAPRLPTPQHPRLHRGLGRLLLTDAIYRGTAPTLPAALASDLEPAQKEAAAALAFALPLRRDPARWLQVVQGEAEVEALAGALGDGEAAWRAAARQDWAAALAQQVTDQPREVQREGLWRAQGLLAPGDSKPEEVAALEQRLGVGGRLRLGALATAPAARWLLPFFAAALAWLLGAWLALQLRRRRDLLTSFYRLEAQAKLRGMRR